MTCRAGTPESTGVFTTLTPPPGRLLRTIALMNDLHHGEDRSGLLAGSGGTLSAGQVERLWELLRADPERPTLVFGHHPVTRHAAVSNPGGPGFVLDRANAAALHGIYRSAPGVFLHHSGHTHRNRVTRPDMGVGVEFLEVAAAKEYPGGYTLLRVYEGGYLVNFYKTRSALAREWSTRTRRQYLGLHPDHALGSCADRNHAVRRDFSGLRAARAQ